RTSSSPDWFRPRGTTIRTNGEHSSKMTGRSVPVSRSILVFDTTSMVSLGRKVACKRFQSAETKGYSEFREQTSARNGIHTLRAVRLRLWSSRARTLLIQTRNGTRTIGTTLLPQWDSVGHCRGGEKTKRSCAQVMG